MRQHGLGVFVVGVLIQLHDVDTGGCHVVYVEEFPFGVSTTPYYDFLCIALDGFVKTSDKGGDDVAVFRVEVVIWPVQVGGHDASVVSSVLPVVALTKFDAGNFCDGIGFVSALQGAGEQGFLFHGLFGHSWIDAR